MGMALTPEDIVNKRFQSTKFRDGYDQDEVDDFLDEVVAEMRRVLQENEDLKQDLQASEARIAELQRSGGESSAEPAAPAAPQPVSASQPQAPTGVPQALGDPVEAESTNNLLQLARRLHEEHVREGIQKRDELIAEGHAQAARVVAEAEAEQRRQLAGFEDQKKGLEGRIEQLRQFERDYRQSLKGFITSQLTTLDQTGVESVAPRTGSSQVVGGQASNEEQTADDSSDEQSTES
jgi:DivIVA domain-containing protein